MKRKTDKILIVWFAWIVMMQSVISSCVPDPLDVSEVPALQPQIVVSSQILADRSVVISLTKTISALDASDDSDPGQLLEQIVIDDATVVVKGPTSSYDLLPLGSGVYGGVIIPFEVSAEYTLQVNSASLGEVSATTTVKPMVRFDDIKASLYFNGFDDTLAQISYKINDPAGKNWYMLTVQEVEKNDVVKNLINPNAYTRLFDDKGFQGQAIEETFRVVPREYKTGDTIAVSFSNMSEEYYRFMKLRQDNRFSLVQFLGEPINYPSNVNGGKGFFNLYIPDVRFFILK